MNHSPRYYPDAHANICLLLEGTFPYVRGGVSSWVRQLIEGMPHLSFSIIYLGADSESAAELAYELPDNVVHLDTHFLLDETAPQDSNEGLWQRLRDKQHAFSTRKSVEQRFVKNSELHTSLRDANGQLSDSVAASFTELLTGTDAIVEQQ